MKRSDITAVAGVPSERDDEMGVSSRREQDGGPSSTSNGDLSEIIDHLRLAAEKGSASLSRTVQTNPTLVLAGVVALGALAGLALHHRRNQPQSIARQIQRDMVKHTRSLRQALRQELKDSGLSAKYDQLGSTLGSIDWKPYIQPLLEKVAALSDDAKSKLSAFGK